MQLPSLFTDGALALPELYTRRGIKHLMYFQPDDVVLAHLRRSCPWIVFEDDDDADSAAVTLPLAEFLRVVCRGIRLVTTELLDSNPGLSSALVSDASMCLLAHYDHDMSIVECPTKDVWDSLLLTHTQAMLET